MTMTHRMKRLLLLLTLSLLSSSSSTVEAKRPHRERSFLREPISTSLSLTPRTTTKRSSSSSVIGRDDLSSPKDQNDPTINNFSSASSSALAVTPGGASATKETKKPPSIYWAVLHNWLYFLSLGFNVINIQFLVREIVDGNAKATPSPRSIALSGKIESVDKLLTFLGVAFLTSLSDTYGRRPLLAWSAVGFALTNLIQARTTSSTSMLYLADFIDGCSSCMLPLCQAYIADVSPPDKLAGNLGIFQGISAGGAFILAFPIGGILGAKYGPRVPLYAAAALQFLNALIVIFLTPESNPHTNKAARNGIPRNQQAELDLSQDNPWGGLVRLFGKPGLLRTAAAVYFLASLARTTLDAQFTNYSNIRFGWTQAQSGPILVMVGFMLAVAPRLLVPRLGLRKAILSGLWIYALGLAGTGLAPSPGGFAASIFVVSIGTMCLPALTALLASLAKPQERGALLGAVGSLTELTGAIGSTMWASVLAQYTSENAPLKGVPGMHFVMGAGLVVLSYFLAMQGFWNNQDHPAFQQKE